MIALLMATLLAAGPTSRPAAFQLELTAEMGQITTPMALHGPAGGQYAASSKMYEGELTFSFQAPAAGEYIVWTHVYGEDGSHDSFTVHADDGPEDIFDCAEGDWGRWQWRVLNGRGSELNSPLTLEPRTFHLAPGGHTLVFKGRETDARLDRIILTSDPAFTPAGPVVLPRKMRAALGHTPPGRTVYRIRDKAASPVDERLFGQFLERPSWGGEMGIESAVTGQAGDIRRDVRQRLEELHATILRFPGGLDVDYLDWCDMVSNVPGREANRPVSLGHSGHAVTNGFGYDEFLALCGQLKSQPILVVNFADALLSRKSPEAAARHAAALVAYVNAPVDAALPEGLAPWPALREQNGRREPYGVRYFQVGNQTGVLLSQLRKGGLSESAANAQYVKCLAAYITAMRAVDPSIQILADACTEELSAALDAALHGQVNFWVQYMELPGDITPATIIRDGRRVRPRDLSPEETWNAWVAVPNDFSPQGESTAEGPALLAAARYGGKVAITDWNWSGRWWRGTRGPLDSAFAKGVGAAGFLHAILRQGDTIDIACQSIAVGSEWATAAIRVTDDFDTPAYLTPTGQVFMLYARHHGTARVEMEGQDIPTYDQPLRMGTLRPAAVVATVDAVATADGNALYFHAINRHFTQDITVTLDLEEFPGLAAGGVQHIFQGRLMDKPAPGEPPSPGAFSDVPIKRGGAALPVLLPKRSVSIVEIPREKTQK